jgi:ATP-dependent exoDNAse (exonuclease V) alpha subunit
MIEEKEKNILAPDGLNEGQKKAFITLSEYLENSSDRSVYVLKGWAGTGKTYVISKLIGKIINKNDKKKKGIFKNSPEIAVTGPTNKSVRVIRQSTGINSHYVNYMTIHKLLGLKEQITEDGKQLFAPDSYLGSNIESVDILFIDEVSMLNDELFEEVIKHRSRMKIICMGDPCQIPPVGRPDCIPFLDDMHERYGIKTIELSEVMRQKGDNPIIESSIVIRNNISSGFLPLDPVSRHNERGEGIEYLSLESKDDRERFSKILEEMLKSEDFKTNQDLVKIIAWRNKTVDTMNKIARKKIYGEDSERSKILVGERMIANSPVFIKDTIVLNTNEEFEIEDFDIDDDKFRMQIADSPAPYMEVHLQFYKCRIKYIGHNGEIIKARIHILHEDSEIEYQKVLRLLKIRAINKKGKDKTWMKYYNFTRRYADVSWGYSISAHKSQGSTYKNVFVLEDDIDKNWDVIERNRIKYTAFTRASSNLFVLKIF